MPWKQGDASGTFVATRGDDRAAGSSLRRETVDAPGRAGVPALQGAPVPALGAGQPARRGRLSPGAPGLYSGPSSPPLWRAVLAAPASSRWDVIDHFR